MNSCKAAAWVKRCVDRANLAYINGRDGEAAFWIKCATYWRYAP